MSIPYTSLSRIFILFTCGIIYIYCKCNVPKFPIHASEMYKTRSQTMHLDDCQKNVSKKTNCLVLFLSKNFLQYVIKGFIVNIKACNELILLFHLRVFPYIHTFIAWILSFYSFPKNNFLVFNTFTRSMKPNITHRRRLVPFILTLNYLKWISARFYLYVTSTVLILSANTTSKYHRRNRNVTGLERERERERENERYRERVRR